MSRGLLLDRAVSLVPEGVQPRLFGQEALGARSGVVLDAGRGPLLLAAAPAAGLAAPRVLEPLESLLFSAAVSFSLEAVAVSGVAACVLEVPLWEDLFRASVFTSASASC